MVPSVLTVEIAASFELFTRVNATRVPSGDHCDSVSYASLPARAVVSRCAPLPSRLATKIPWLVGWPGAESSSKEICEPSGE